jgi:hypothetical protein
MSTDSREAIEREYADGVIRTRQEDAVLEVTLDRPKANAIDPPPAG